METNPVIQQTPVHDQRNPNNSGDPRRMRQVYKSPLAAGMLSFLPGLGQVYLGYYKHGFIFFTTFAALVMVAGSMEEPVLPIFIFGCIFFYCFSVIDAVRRARLYNQVIDGISEADLPTGFDIPSVQGSIGLGVVFVVVGSILFLHTMFGMSLAWIADWWPMGVIGFGGYLIYKEMQERQNNHEDISASVDKQI